MESLMTTKEVANLFGVKVQTVRRWVKMGLLEALKPGGHLRFQRHEVRALMAAFPALKVDG